MIRFLGEPQNPRTFWLVLLLAVMLLVGISSSPAAAMAERDRQGLVKEIGALVALGEALQQAGPDLASPVHPDLADGGSVWLANLSVRRMRSLQRTLRVLEDRNGPRGEGSEHRRLVLEADRVHWDLLAFRTGHDDPVRLGQSLIRLAQVEPAAEWPPRVASPASMPIILRGTGF